MILIICWRGESPRIIRPGLDDVIGRLLQVRPKSRKWAPIDYYADFEAVLHVVTLRTDNESACAGKTLPKESSFPKF
nr:ASN_HP1_G0050680.mRNA.1.CDS.1 [Saccharomyces cerevisiae]